MTNSKILRGISIGHRTLRSKQPKLVGGPVDAIETAVDNYVKNAENLKGMDTSEVTRVRNAIVDLLILPRPDYAVAGLPVRRHRNTHP